MRIRTITITAFSLLQLFGATGFAQSLSLARLGVPFQNTNLDVRWQATNGSLPTTVWMYRVLPRTFPPAAISNLILRCGLKEADRKASNDQVTYNTADGMRSKQLTVSPGTIFYHTVTRYGPTNLATDIPPTNAIPSLTTHFLSELGIQLSEINKDSHGNPDFHFWEPFKEYFLPGKTVTNVEFRAVSFQRAVDGAPVIGTGTVGDGEIYFGEHGVPVHIDISWRNIERYKSFRTASSQLIIACIRQGKALQGGIPMNLPPIDWNSVKSLTIKKAELCYYAGDRITPGKWLMPIASLWSTVDTGHGNIDLEIDSPIIDTRK